MKIDKGTIIAIIIFAIGVILAIGAYKNKVDNNVVTIDAHDGKIEELSEFSIKQTMALERVQEKTFEQQEQMIQQFQQVQDFQELNARSLKVIEKLEEKVK
jgi:hypothetical protein